jgi:hypothetical protein
MAPSLGIFHLLVEHMVLQHLHNHFLLLIIQWVCVHCNNNLDLLSSLTNENTYCIIANTLMGSQRKEALMAIAIINETSAADRNEDIIPLDALLFTRITRGDGFSTGQTSS